MKNLGSEECVSNKGFPQSLFWFMWLLIGNVSFREKRTGNTLYQELSFQDSEALGDVDEGADITGEESSFFATLINCKSKLLICTVFAHKSTPKYLPCIVKHLLQI